MGDTARLSSDEIEAKLPSLPPVNDSSPIQEADVQTDQQSPTQSLYPKIFLLDDDQTLYEESNPYKSHKITIDDWSETGRGSHVEFEKQETISLQQGMPADPRRQGRWLGRGVTGDVYETTVQGWQVAHKRLVINRKHLDRAQREIDILKRLSTHVHVVQLIGTLGCLISAIAYLHDENIKIRHKDLKPSNILLSAENLWLSDFGSATDFSLLSQSATDNERGTLRYFSPEVAAWQPNGRAADIFSLGCVLLEIIVLHDRGTLEHIRQNRSQDPSFHSNLDRVDIWCNMVNDDSRSAMFHVLREIKYMLSKDAAMRPTAHEVLTRVTGYDLADSRSDKQPIFGRCCATSLVSDRQR
ncbi:kinase-like domain-containing protein, partial [Phaeosphaeria sp. MPI-PUGE-AT-0046c]